MSSIQFRTLEDKDFPEWCAFHDELYGKGYALTDREFLSWYMKKDGKYETLIAVDGKAIVGVYGVLPFPLWVKDAVYDACWIVNGMVRSEYRNQGIGKTFVNMLLDRFDVCGGLAFNEEVRRNYVRFGFKQFEEKTLRRYALMLRKDAYSLIPENQRENIRKLFLWEEVKKYVVLFDVKRLEKFDDFLIEPFKEMKAFIGKATLERTPEYLNWRYFQNPRVQYECDGIFDEGHFCRAYVVSRRERLYPTNLYATRIVDMMGSCHYLGNGLLQYEINKAVKRNDAFIDFSFTGDYYAHLLYCFRFAEVLGQLYGAVPLVSSPIEYRKNEEFICLGSRKYPDLFSDVEFDDLYFTRGDSDRDRYNPVGNVKSE